LYQNSISALTQPRRGMLQPGRLPDDMGYFPG
jgi:hypothetical protein